MVIFFFFFQAEDGIRDIGVTGVQTCALPICRLRPCGGPSTARLACRSRAKAARYAPTPRPSARCALPRLFAPPPPPPRDATRRGGFSRGFYGLWHLTHRLRANLVHDQAAFSAMVRCS